MENHKKLKIGFIGQGYVGKNYANDFEARGYSIVRYALEEPYINNKEAISTCDVVFIAVPTPSTPQGFDASIVEGSLQLVKSGAIAVIKSTVVPGTIAMWQEAHPDIKLIFSPEFLREATAAFDAAHPFTNIVGHAKDNEEHVVAAKLVQSILPEANTNILCSSTEAEIIKYLQNISGYINILTFNIFYDFAQKMNADWTPILTAMEADPDIPSRFANPIHKSGRGAGGHCLIKDMAAFREIYEKTIPSDNLSVSIFKLFEEKNKELLLNSKKDLDLLEGVYGKLQ